MLHVNVFPRSIILADERVLAVATIVSTCLTLCKPASRIHKSHRLQMSLKLSALPMWEHHVSDYSRSSLEFLPRDFSFCEQDETPCGAFGKDVFGLVRLVGHRQEPASRLEKS